MCKCVIDNLTLYDFLSPFSLTHVLKPGSLVLELTPFFNMTKILLSQKFLLKLELHFLHTICFRLLGLIVLNPCRFSSSSLSVVLLYPLILILQYSLKKRSSDEEVSWESISLRDLNLLI